jgi:hypothetical protein
VDLLARRWDVSKRPREEDARCLLATAVLASAKDVSAADLGGALGWRLKRSRETLDRLVELGMAERRELQGLPLWNAAP